MSNKYFKTFESLLSERKDKTITKSQEIVLKAKELQKKKEDNEKAFSKKYNDVILKQAKSF